VGIGRGGLFVGTAGWSVASRYAEAVPGPGTHLERYASRLDAVEINSSFYGPHQHKTYERWARSTPDNFRFSVKVPKAITHERALVDCAFLTDAFAGEIAGLGEKLAVLLVQLPRTSSVDRATAERFFDHLRSLSDAGIAFEPRHADWFTPDADTWLTERQVARVAADPEPAPGAGEPGGWSGLRYYRWHGSPRLYYSDYDEAALAAFRTRAEADRAEAPVWCVFDNTASGAALGNALTFAGL
jgi:uncharacterized protein YecE (DUF72 family)